MDMHPLNLAPSTQFHWLTNAAICPALMIVCNYFVVLMCILFFCCFYFSLEGFWLLRVYFLPRLQEPRQEEMVLNVTHICHEQFAAGLMVSGLQYSNYSLCGHA